jgi:hypothetical protein
MFTALLSRSCLLFKLLTLAFAGWLVIAQSSTWQAPDEVLHANRSILLHLCCCSNY